MPTFSMLTLYTEGVRRLLQLGVLLLGLAAVAVPLMEVLDRWDAPGPPMNDTELGVFGFILVLALLLLVSRLIAALDRLVEVGAVFRPQTAVATLAEAAAGLVFAVIPHSSPPLRI